MAWTVSTVLSAVCAAATSNRARIAVITDRAIGPVTVNSQCFSKPMCAIAFRLCVFGC